jgi:hypothetical protein
LIEQLVACQPTSKKTFAVEQIVLCHAQIQIQILLFLNLKTIQRNLISVVTETGPFFIETSGSGDLSFRQACAVESLALHNPNLTVYVLFVNVKINSSVSTLNVLKKEYENIRLIKHQSGRLHGRDTIRVLASLY